jgi:GntR family transcriptional regulator
VDKDAPLPLHAQVASALRSEIHDEHLAPGSPLPSEADLQAQFGVSRSVVRQAMATLVAEGLVQRARGRGSVVAPARQHGRLVAHPSGLFAQLAAEGIEVATRVVRLQPEPAGEAAAQLGTEHVLRLERLRSSRSQPLAYIRTYLPLPWCDVLTAESLTDASLHEVLRLKLGARATSGRRQIRAVPADPGLAQLLDVRTGEPLLLLEGTSVDQGGAPLEVFSTWHRADLVAFDLDMRDADEPSSGSMPVPTPESLRAAAVAARDLAAQLSALAWPGVRSSEESPRR